MNHLFLFVFYHHIFLCHLGFWLQRCAKTNSSFIVIGKWSETQLITWKCSLYGRFINVSKCLYNMTFCTCAIIIPHKFLLNHTHMKALFLHYHNHNFSSKPSAKTYRSISIFLFSTLFQVLTKELSQCQQQLYANMWKQK